MELPDDRVVADGKTFRRGRDPFRVRGVTYGSFTERADGWRYPDSARIKQDLQAMALAGLNTVRTYSLPPPEVIDVSTELGLNLLIGLDYHDWRTDHHHGRRARDRILDSGRRAVAETMEAVDGSPAVLAIAVGNEVPVDLVRLHGSKTVEDVLTKLIADVHSADPNMLATYVNFPTTEYLEPGGQDFLAFNVFLEDRLAMRRYLHHLNVLAEHKPLVLTEFGLAADIHGEPAQAESLERQLTVLDEVGCAGGTVFSWTDEWGVDDVPVEGWGFGITTEEREPKPARDVVQAWAQAPYPSGLREVWPRITVIVCAYNEERHITACLGSLTRTSYPDLEIIVCDDGSTDRTLDLAKAFPFTILELPHQGLSAARNAGLAAASGELVAYLDADAECHPDWPYHLALSLEDPDVAATGGPNIPFADAGFIERAVGHSPGAPSEVLFTADRAEHVPGCNMAFRRNVLEAVGGFNPTYTSAGDDVDVCWKLLDRGYNIGFSPAAQVSHHRRATVIGYLKQQRSYGRAERMLAGAHAHRFNRLGSARWYGVLYGSSRILPSVLKPVVYTGYMGMAPFQPISQRPSEIMATSVTALVPLAVPLTLVGLVLATVSRWWLLVPFLAVLALVVHAAAVALALRVGHSEPTPRRLRALVGLFHILQPLARGWGRLTGQKVKPSTSPRPDWMGDRAAWIRDLRRILKGDGLTVRAGPPGADWDLEARRSPAASARIVTAVAWRWEPRYRVAYRLHWPSWGLGLAGALLGVAGSPWGWAFAGVAVVWGGVTLLSLRRTIGRACAETTRGHKL